MDRIEEYIGFKFLTDAEMGKRMVKKKYEKQEIFLLNEIPNIATMSVLELGGCLGVVSVATNQMLENKNNHIVVEANPKMIRYLRHNRDLNNCKFQIENAIISDSHDGVFYSYDKLVAGSAHRMDNKEKNKTKHNVNVISYKDLVSKYKIEFDVLIIDIEGGELEILKEIREITSIKYIMIEIHEKLMYSGFRKECFDVLENMEFILIKRCGKESFLFKK